MALKSEDTSDPLGDVVPTIASFLPLKYLFRLKLLSTSWNSIITSDPVFTLTHLQNSNSSSNLFLRQYKSCRHGYYYSPYKQAFFCLDKFQGGDLRSQATNFAGPEGCDTVLCHCNGVLLLTDSRYGPTKYVLWNPSIGKNLDFRFPHQLYSNASYGICYDPVMHDFKVVFISGTEHGVFSFKKNSWTEKTGLPYKGTAPAPGLYVDGALYWVWSDNRTRHVVYFDSRRDELKRLGKPRGLANDDRSLLLACLDGDLYLYCNTGDETTVRMWVKEKGIVENCWKEFVTIENVETRIDTFRPLCLMGGKMVVELQGDRYVMYRFDEKRFEKVEEFIDKQYYCSDLIPYEESLLFPALDLEDTSVRKTRKRKKRIFPRFPN